MTGKDRASCETCAFYVYDDEYGAYLCDMNMDEDDYARITGTGMSTLWSESRCNAFPI